MGIQRSASRPARSSADFSGVLDKVRRRYRYFAISLAILAISQSAEAQKIIATVPIPSYGQSIAVNPVTHKIYTVDEPENVLTEIDGQSFKRTVIPLGPTTERSADGTIRIDSVRNKLYAINVANSSVAVIDGATHVVRFVPAGPAFPCPQKFSHVP